MENLLLIMIFVAISATACVMFFYVKKLKNLFLHKYISKKFADKQVYSSLIIDDICNYIFKIGRAKQKEILKNLFSGDINALYNQIDKEDIKQKIDLCDNKNIKTKSSDVVYLLTKAKLHLKQNEHDKALNMLQKLDLKKMSLHQKIYYKFLIAQISVFEGDLLTASEDLSLCLKFFKKKNMLFEEAETYFILGTIYRISGVYDTADFMLKASQEIYAHTGSSKGEAEALGTLGLLMSVQDRFDEAQDYYQKALKKAVCDKILSEFIEAQQAMLELVRGNLKKSSKIANDVLKKTKSPKVQATVLDILSRIELNMKKYSSASQYANQAAEIFFKAKNYPSAFECLYIKASALAESKKLDESEKVLRDLIEKEKKHKSCFHIAGAHTLLGLVLMKKNEPDRAKDVFNQALSKELCNNRKSGVAIDYANLALVAKLQGNAKEADENLEKALSLAKEADENLINKIKAILD